MVNDHVTEHFKFRECVCPCCDRLKIIPVFFSHMELLEKMRETLGFPIMINSGYRCPEYNATIGGAKLSQHMNFATDIRPAWVKGYGEEEWVKRLQAMCEEAERLNFKGLGIYGTFIHLDLRIEKTRWRG